MDLIKRTSCPSLSASFPVFSSLLCAAFLHAFASLLVFFACQLENENIPYILLLNNCLISVEIISRIVWNVQHLNGKFSIESYLADQHLENNKFKDIFQLMKSKLNSNFNKPLTKAKELLVCPFAH